MEKLPYPVKRKSTVQMDTQIIPVANLQQDALLLHFIRNHQ
jgi:hypothetical protein